MFEVIRNPDSNRVEKMYRRFGKDNCKKIEVTFFNGNNSVYIHLNDLRRGKCVTMSKAEFNELMEIRGTIGYAISLVESDGLAEAQQQQQQQAQQVQAQVQAAVQQIEPIYQQDQPQPAPTAPAPTPKKRRHHD